MSVIVSVVYDIRGPIVICECVSVSFLVSCIYSDVLVWNCLTFAAYFVSNSCVALWRAEAKSSEHLSITKTQIYPRSHSGNQMPPLYMCLGSSQDHPPCI